MRYLKELAMRLLLSFSLLLLPAFAAGLSAEVNFKLRPLSSQEIHFHFGSNNPVKELLFKREYKAFFIQIDNATAAQLLIRSSVADPAPLHPVAATKKLSQSKAAAPWIIGAGWAAILTNVVGFALISSLVLGATIIVAGVVGLNNTHLPKPTNHSIKHLLLDGIHDYVVPAYEQLEIIVLLPAGSSSFTLPYLANNTLFTPTIPLVDAKHRSKKQKAML